MRILTDDQLRKLSELAVPGETEIDLDGRHDEESLNDELMGLGLVRRYEDPEFVYWSITDRGRRELALQLACRKSIT